MVLHNAAECYVILHDTILYLIILYCITLHCIICLFRLLTWMVTHVGTSASVLVQAFLPTMITVSATVGALLSLPSQRTHLWG